MFFKNIHKRIKMVSVIIIFLFILIILKVFYIQVFSYKKLNKYANSLWSRNLPLEANRGLIYDTNGNILAKKTGKTLKNFRFFKYFSHKFINFSQILSFL